MVDSGAEESCANPESFPQETPDIKGAVPLIAVEGSAITTHGLIQPQVTLQSNTGHVEAEFRMQSAEVTDDVMCMANLEDAGAKIMFLGEQGRWVVLPNGTFVELEREGKRYYLNYELSDAPTTSADTSAKLVAPNAVEEGEGVEDEGDKMFEDFSHEQFEPALLEKVQIQLEKENEIEVNDDMMLEQCIHLKSNSEVNAKPQPAQPTPEQVALHNYLHIDYEDWCEHCVAAKAREDAHERASAEVQADRSRRVIQGDYAFFARDGKRVESEDLTHSPLATSLNVLETETQYPLSIYVPRKGTDKYAISVLVNFVKRLRHQVTFQTDRQRITHQSSL